jgi:hypothetical protein
MKITIDTSSYNERRYGKPYIGVLNPTDGRVIRWGTWIGTAGEAGILEVDAAPGDVIIKGQKDNRGNNGTSDYAVIMADYSLEYMSKAKAIKTARAIQATPTPEPTSEPTLQDLLAALGATTTTEAMARIKALAVINAEGSKP